MVDTNKCKESKQAEQQTRQAQEVLGTCQSAINGPEQMPAPSMAVPGLQPQSISETLHAKIESMENRRGKNHPLDTFRTWIRDVLQQPVLKADRLQAQKAQPAENVYAPVMVQIAGTNGKGSVSRWLSLLLQSQGLRVGTFTSPHLLQHFERISIDGHPIPAKDWEDMYDTYLAFFEEQQLTMFEIDLFMALAYFWKEKPDVLLMEVGMGGTLDATTALDYDLSLITNIGMDHMAFLGETLEVIAAAKAGIIQQGVPVITTETRAECLHVIASAASVHQAPLYGLRLLEGKDDPQDTSLQQESADSLEQTEEDVRDLAGSGSFADPEEVDSADIHEKDASAANPASDAETSTETNADTDTDEFDQPFLQGEQQALLPAYAMPGTAFEETLPPVPDPAASATLFAQMEADSKRLYPWSKQLPYYQKTNALLALEAFRHMGYTLNDEIVRQVLDAFAWPARFMTLKQDPWIVLDGAHNVPGIQALCDSISPGEFEQVYFSVLADKQAAQMLELLLEKTENITLVDFDSYRKVDVFTLGEMYGFPVVTIHEMMEELRNTRLNTLICGSLYFAGAVLEEVHLLDADDRVRAAAGGDAQDLYDADAKQDPESPDRADTDFHA